MRSARWFTDETAWSAAEKKTARRAFDRAYQRKCADVAAEVKKMVAGPSSPSDLWQIHDYLSEQRETTDLTFDYRYSVLLSVFGHLLREGWLTEADLLGLEQDKIEKIKRWASL
jgi:Photoprotection regulator fluorescence recovery protein